MSRQQKGKEGEDLAASLLQKQGYEILQRNYRFDRGEIDIVAHEGGELVFVEVKSRHGDRFGSPEEAVTPAKEEQLKKVAEGYLLEHKLADQACRFDVVSITFEGRAPRVSIIRSAFV
jgi:putative endonuclease